MQHKKNNLKPKDNRYKKTAVILEWVTAVFIIDKKQVTIRLTLFFLHKNESLKKIIIFLILSNLLSLPPVLVNERQRTSLLLFFTRKEVVTVL